MNFIENETAQKLRGGYYTPLELAVFLAKWVKDINPKSVLEPSCGNGIFFEAMSEIKGFSKAQITGFELDPQEASFASQRAASAGLKTTKVIPDDFLGWAISNMKSNEDRFDAVLGNPPFVRYQYLPQPFQHRAEQIFNALNLPFTKHTNAWVPFILASMAMLKPGGRLAMVVPSEIIHVTHAQSLRTYLGNECSRLVIIDPEEIWFSDTLQGAVILLAEKKKCILEDGEGLGIYPVRGREFLSIPPKGIFNTPVPINGMTVEGKWTRAILDVKTREVLNEAIRLPDVRIFNDIAKVDVGIVTGANKFFLVDDATVQERHIQKWAYPMFGRSGHCPGLIYDEQQHKANAGSGYPTNFIWIDEKKAPLDAATKAYIRSGEEMSLHTRFKCRVRKPWYTVPSVHATEIGMLKRSHNTPRLILNKLRAYTTDTAYRIKSFDTPAEKLVSCFVNPLTALSAELEGRHYGGGVLELTPSEIERLLVPVPAKFKPCIEKLDEQVRTLSTDEVLQKQSKAILGAIGISKNDQETILNGWKMLRDRRQRNLYEAVEE